MKPISSKGRVYDCSVHRTRLVEQKAMTERVRWQIKKLKRKTLAE